ncbi:glycogen synthase GlgA [Segnochrobactrum spirostomi]|uniref:Glycogen synthase n=1 Tax=Segnochrobactrum spirostomi TaxID=2608987 RepID=A0A6A7XYU6_9HYPH|nr:glycogen synthase GlgA [Segnochrobactrum spirostomi]MQT11625.1 glycogen synthase GlgA [Segnochrobactrum spirostomi]
MRVLFVTSEMAGFSKAGGLGDVSASLPRALRARGLDIRVLMPAYPGVLAKIGPIEIVAQLPGLSDVPAAQLGYTLLDDGQGVFVLICPELYERPGTSYVDAHGRDFEDNDVRFARLGLAAAQIAGGVLPGWQPETVHAHDWPASFALAYTRWTQAPVSTVLTVHNLAHQGIFPKERLGPLGVPDYAFAMEGVEFHDQISFLKAGLFYADRVTTVSPTYAREITTEALGCGLHGLLAGIADAGRLDGIVNGIDEQWGIRDGVRLPERSSAREAARRAQARFVRTSLCLAPSRGPLFGMLSRLVPQKGIDLVIDLAGEIVRRGGQIAAIGMGDPDLERGMLGLSKRYPGSVGTLIGYAEPLAARITAGSDFLLMPSRFEPCGLSQMYAQTCGSLPIAHATGGLNDTVRDGVTGFLFRRFSRTDFRGALERAFETYADAPRLRAMRAEAAAQDFGWGRSAHAYENIYRASRGLPPVAAQAAEAGQTLSARVVAPVSRASTNRGLFGRGRLKLVG